MSGSVSPRLPYSPTVRRRRLSAELKRMRDNAGLTMAKAAKALDWATNKLQRTESGERKTVPTGDLDDLLDLYGVTDTTVREAMHDLAAQATERGWWSTYRDVFTNSLPDFENEASTIRTYEPQVIPGLLQIPDYIAAVFRGSEVTDDEEVKRYVEARLSRQEILNRIEPPSYWAIIDEAALRRPIGSPETMALQVRHLINMASRNHVDIQVLPLSAGAHAALGGSFILIDYANPLDASIAYTENNTDSLFGEDERTVARYNRIFSHLLTMSLTAPQTLEFLDGLQSSLREDTDV